MDFDMHLNAKTRTEQAGQGRALIE